MKPSPTLEEIRERHRVSAPYKPEYMQDYSQSVADYNRCREDRATLLTMLETGRDEVVEAAAMACDAIADSHAFSAAPIIAGKHDGARMCAREVRALKSGAAVSPAAVMTEEQLFTVLREKVFPAGCSIEALTTRADKERIAHECAKAIHALLHPTHIVEKATES